MTDTKQKILIIEDDQYTRELYRDILTDAGYEVITSTDGEEGLKKALEGGYSLIVLDVMLPKRDGLSILSAVKAAQSVRNTPVMFVTNLSGNEIVSEALKFGAKACYVKTDLNPEDLINCVHTYAASNGGS